MQFLALCLLLAPAVYGAAIEVEKCAWGESYWCSELSIAKTCGAIQHCKTTVWTRQQLTQDSSEVCEFCQAIVEDVRKFVEDKRTQADISHFLSTACAIIPNPKAANECKTIVDEYAAEIIDLVVAEVTSQEICGLIHLCTGLKDTVRHVGITETIKTNDQKLCTDCKAFFGDIVQQITGNVTLNELEDLINKEICSKMGTFKDECQQMVQEFLPLAMQYLQQLMDPDALCQTMKFCTPASQQAKILSDLLKTTPYYGSLRKAHAESETECLLCKAVFTEYRSMLRDQTIQTRITNLIKNDVCPTLGSLKDMCVAVVDQHIREAFEFLVTVLDPDTRCISFGFCPAAAAAEIENPVNIVRDATPREVKSATPAACILCEYVMKEIDTILEDNRTEAKIMEALDKVCTILPSTVRQSCVDFINTYGRAILSILETEVTPAQVCTLLGLCKAPSHVVDLLEKPKVKAGDAETCLICETIIQYVESLIQDNSTVVEIEAIVEKVCNFLPSTMKTECDALIEQYGTLIVQYIVAKYNPKEVCTLIKLCTSAQAVPMMNLVPPKAVPAVSGRCSYGPVYWCSSWQSAEECGAVSHCKTYVWGNK